VGQSLGIAPRPIQARGILQAARARLASRAEGHGPHQIRKFLVRALFQEELDQGNRAIAGGAVERRLSQLRATRDGRVVVSARQADAGREEAAARAALTLF